MACLWRLWKKRRQVGVSVGDEPSSTSSISRRPVDYSIFAASTSAEAPIAEVRPQPPDTHQRSPADEAPSTSTTDHTRSKEDPPTHAAKGVAAPSTSLTQEELDCLGFPNLGNTCYMNAALQALLTLKPFIDEFAVQVEVASSSSVIRVFADVVSCRCSNDVAEKEAVLSTFKQLVGQFDPKFDNADQNDACRFLMSVLNMLRFASLDLQRTATSLGLAYACPVQTHVTFRLARILTCIRCGFTSTTEYDRTTFELRTFRGPSVRDSLAIYLQGYLCPHVCRCGNGISVQRWLFLSLPNILILPLKKFIKRRNGTKQRRQPVSLSPHLVICSSHQNLTRYSLVSVISHLGSSADQGHYVCDGVYREEHGRMANLWFNYNDDRVGQSSGSSVYLKYDSAPTLSKHTLKVTSVQKF